MVLRNLLWGSSWFSSRHSRWTAGSAVFVLSAFFSGFLLCGELSQIEVAAALEEEAVSGEGGELPFLREEYVAVEGIAGRRREDVHAGEGGDEGKGVSGAAQGAEDEDDVVSFVKLSDFLRAVDTGYVYDSAVLCDILLILSEVSSDRGEDSLLCHVRTVVVWITAVSLRLDIEQHISLSGVENHTEGGVEGHVSFDGGCTGGRRSTAVVGGDSSEYVPLLPQR